jgi:hypothetical protein
MNIRVTFLPLVLAAASLAQANLLLNGDLDKTYDQEILPGFFLPKPLDWINDGFRLSVPYEDELSSEPWAGPAPTPVTTNGIASDDWGVFFKPFTGNIAFGPANGHLHQTVAGSAGMTYTLTGWAGAEANALLTDARFAIEFLNAGGSIISSQSISLMSTLFVVNGQPFNYKQYTVMGVAPAGTTQVRVRASMIDAMANPAGGGQAYVVDDFDLTASGGAVVAHPSSYTILEGLELGGNLASLAASDNDKVTILNDELDTNALIEFTGGAAGLGGGNVSLKVETSASRNDLSEFLRAFNYSTNAFVQVNFRVSSLTDVTTTVTLSSQYVSGSNDVKGRIQWIPQADLEAADGWTETVDLVEWMKL